MGRGGIGILGFPPTTLDFGLCMLANTTNCYKSAR
jgi:hypothetical protein